jgi:hypothetical protein
MSYIGAEMTRRDKFALTPGSIGPLVGLALAVSALGLAACGDYIEGPPPAPYEPVEVVLEEDAGAPTPAPPAGETPRRDAGPATDGGAPSDAAVVERAIPAPLTGGHLYYSFGGEVHRIAARAGAAPENVSRALGKLGGPGTDTRITASRDSRWMLFTSDRFGGCSSECLVMAPSDLSWVDVVRPGGRAFTPQGVAAIRPVTGDLIVYAASGGPHQVDVFATRKVSGRWSEPVLLSRGSSYPYNNMPALTLDGTRVTFDCGQNMYPETGDNDACEVGIDGTGFRRVAFASMLPNARQSHVQNPHEGTDGLYFEAAWPVAGRAVAPEIIWRLPKGASVPVPAAPSDNAVSPCPLPDGRYAALWLAGPRNSRGDHELAVFGSGMSPIVLTPGVDVTDVGLGCAD